MDLALRMQRAMAKKGEQVEEGVGSVTLFSARLR